MATAPKPNAAVLAARGRRQSRASAARNRDRWYINEVANAVNLTAKDRVTLATDWLRGKVVKNISRPVTKATGPRGGRVVTNRSKPGEFPKADYTLLMKSIFGEVVTPVLGACYGAVGTTLDYGLILETRMDRAFLTRTFNEELGNLKRILGTGK